MLGGLPVLGESADTLLGINMHHGELRKSKSANSVASASVSNIAMGEWNSGARCPICLHLESLNPC